MALANGIDSDPKVEILCILILEKNNASFASVTTLWMVSSLPIKSTRDN